MTLPMPSRSGSPEGATRVGVEQMCDLGSRSDVDRVARPGADPLTEYANHGCRAEIGHDMRFAAGRLNHGDLGRKTPFGQREMLRPCTIDCRATVSISL